MHFFLGALRVDVLFFRYCREDIVQPKSECQDQRDWVRFRSYSKFEIKIAPPFNQMVRHGYWPVTTRTPYIDCPRIHQIRQIGTEIWFGMNGKMQRCHQNYNPSRGNIFMIGMLHECKYLLPYCCASQK